MPAVPAAGRDLRGALPLLVSRAKGAENDLRYRPGKLQADQGQGKDSSWESSLAIAVW